jgi:multicomponent Na+:H+ antiporter subunit A
VGALSRPTAGSPSVAAEHLRMAPEAHGKDVVTVILADFRGLDTLGEITVVGIALVGVEALLRRSVAA